MQKGIKIKMTPLKKQRLTNNELRGDEILWKSAGKSDVVDVSVYFCFVKQVCMGMGMGIMVNGIHDEWNAALMQPKCI